MAAKCSFIHNRAKTDGCCHGYDSNVSRGNSIKRLIAGHSYNHLFLSHGRGHLLLSSSFIRIADSILSLVILNSKKSPERGKGGEKGMKKAPSKEALAKEAAWWDRFKKVVKKNSEKICHS